MRLFELYQPLTEAQLNSKADRLFESIMTMINEMDPMDFKSDKSFVGKGKTTDSGVGIEQRKAHTDKAEKEKLIAQWNHISKLAKQGASAKHIAILKQKIKAAAQGKGITLT